MPQPDNKALSPMQALQNAANIYAASQSDFLSGGLTQESVNSIIEAFIKIATSEAPKAYWQPQQLPGVVSGDTYGQFPGYNTQQLPGVGSSLISDAEQFADFINQWGFFKSNDKWVSENMHYSGCRYTTKELYQISKHPAAVPVKYDDMWEELLDELSNDLCPVEMFGAKKVIEILKSKYKITKKI